jgi:hypothetical protein
MKTNASPATRNSSDPNHPPLARDAHGNLVSIPDGTAAWCLKRETGGRPRMILGADRQPARFQLDVTIDDLEAMLGAGTYRVYAADQVGDVDYVTTVVMGGAREERDDDLVPATSNASRGLGSDLRHALETIREIARAQADSLKAVAASQADWVKGLAVAKQLPRNGIQFVPQPPRYREEEDDDDGGPEEDDSTPARVPGGLPPWVVAVADSVNNVTQTVKMVVAAKQGQNAAVDPPRNAASTRKRLNPMTHLAQINARLNRLERLYLSTALRKADADAVTDELLGLSVDDAVAMIQDAVVNVEANRNAVPEESEHVPEPQPADDFMSHVLAVSAFLSAEERATVMWLLPRFSPARTEEIRAQLLAMTAEDAAAWIKENLDALRAEVPS